MYQIEVSSRKPQPWSPFHLLISGFYDFLLSLPSRCSHGDSVILSRSVPEEVVYLCRVCVIDLFITP